MFGNDQFPAWGITSLPNTRSLVWTRGDMIQDWIESHYGVLDPGEQVWIALSMTICI